MSVNKVILIGHLGNDVEIKYTQTGDSVCNFSLATNEFGKDKEKRVEWHRIVAWGKLAEFCSQYLEKGKQVYLEGRLQTRSWEKEGKKFYTTEIFASTIQFVGTKGEGGDEQFERKGKKNSHIPVENFPPIQVNQYSLDDIPF